MAFVSGEVYLICMKMAMLIKNPANPDKMIASQISLDMTIFVYRGSRGSVSPVTMTIGNNMTVAKTVL